MQLDVIPERNLFLVVPGSYDVVISIGTPPVTDIECERRGSVLTTLYTLCPTVISLHFNDGPTTLHNYAIRDIIQTQPTRVLICSDELRKSVVTGLMFFEYVDVRMRVLKF